jgi:hypothetical protein
MGQFLPGPAEGLLRIVGGHNDHDYFPADHQVPQLRESTFQPKENNDGFRDYIRAVCVRDVFPNPRSPWCIILGKHPHSSKGI